METEKTMENGVMCTCRPETRNKPDESSGRINAYYDKGCPVHDEIAFREAVLQLLERTQKEQKEWQAQESKRD